MPKLIVKTSVVSSYNKTQPIIYLSKNNSVVFYDRTYYSILDTLISYQVSLEFQCKSGYCGICRIRLLSGKVKYYREPIAFIGHSEILPCCCLPINDLKIDL